jgi:6-phosphogluconolactonase
MSFARAMGMVLVLAVIGGIVPTSAENAAYGKYWVYVGTANYEGAPSRKLHLCSFDTETGELKLIGLAAETENPGFLAVHPNQRYLYATNEVGEFRGQKTGSVSSFRIDQTTGKLDLLNQVQSFGANPAYITVSRNGRFVLVSSYYGGTISLPIEGDGSLGSATGEVRESGTGVNPKRQESPHPHAVVLSPDNRFVVTPDLGLDKLFVYRFDESDGSLKANSPAFVQAPAGSGPRHIAFTPDAKFAYTVNELQSTVSTYSFNEHAGNFKLRQTVSTLPRAFRGENTGAEIQIGPSGRFLYASNRGHDSIAVFAVSSRDGILSPEQDVSTLGKTPRNFVFDPSGRFVLIGNQDSDKVLVFRVDPATGHLAPTGGNVSLGSPVCIAFAARKWAN